MKKLISLIMIIFLSATVFSGCENRPVHDESEKLNIVVTIFPIYNWVKNIVTDKADVTLLLDNGVDMHSFQPSVDDIIKISACDVLVYVGGESDKWVDKVLLQPTNKNMLVINLLKILGENVKKEETVEGMQAESKYDAESDEHIWLSIKNAVNLCREIANKLGEADINNKDYYADNAKKYIEALNGLDKKYQSAVENAETKTLVFGDRFPFRYFVDDYNLSYYAAFSGCSAETEASFETVVFLANKVDELGLDAIIYLETSDGAVAKTIKENTISKNQKLVKFDSMQSTTSSDIENGQTYISVMENNLKALKEALIKRSE